MLRFSEVRAELNHLGVVIGREPDTGEWRLAWQGLERDIASNTARYTDTLESALAIGKEMAELRDRMTIQITSIDHLAKRLREIGGTVTGDYVNFWNDRAEQLESWARTLRSGGQIDHTYAAQVMREFAATAGVTL
jgi:hypothetical protein